VKAAGRRIVSAAVFGYCAWELAHPGNGALLDMVDLAIHETGHLVFGPFGELVGFAGGTLFQLIMPLAFVGYFWRRDDQHAASVALACVAQNLAHIAPYVADARAQELPLVGGGEHDWAYLLGRFGLMAHDRGLAHGILALGWLLLLATTAWGLATGDHAEPRDRMAEPI
jgi:hypothetical protein